MHKKNKNTHIQIAIASDNKYAPYTATTIASIIHNNLKNNKITFHYLIPPNFSKTNKTKTLSLIKNKNQYSVNFINMGDAFSDTKSQIKHLTNQTYYRLLLAKIIKEKKCLYLDSDTITEKDLSKLFKTRLKDNYVAGVKAAGHHTIDGNIQHCKLLGIKNINQYINAGVILLNLHQIRNDNLTKKFLDLEKKNLPSDQDIINSACFDKIKHLPLKFNSMAPYFSTSEKEKNAIRIFGKKQVKEAKENPVIIHYVAEKKPWNNQDVPKSDRFWFYFKKTPYWNNNTQQKKNEEKKIIEKIIRRNSNMNQNINVLFFSHNSQLTGSERSLLELIKELKEKNIFSHVVLPNNGPMEGELKKLNTPYDIVNFGWWANLDKKENDIASTDWKRHFENIIDYLPKISLVNPDLIYSNTIASPWGAIAANYLSKPHIWHIREYGELDHKFKFDLPYQNTIQFIENHSDHIITNSKSVANHISQYLTTKKPTPVYNFVSIDPELQKEKIKSPYKNKKSLKILVCATIHPGKNQLEAVKAIKEVANSELLLIGGVSNPSYFEEISQYIQKNKLENRIHILDFIKNPYPYFLASDIILIPSHKEAFGRTAIEAMILKKPVIATIEGGTSEIIKNNINGFVYHLGDIKELKKILTNLQDQGLRKKIGIAGHKSLKEINQKSTYGYKIAKIIKSTIKNRSNPNKDNLSKLLLDIIQKYQHEKRELVVQTEKDKSQIEETKNQLSQLQFQLEKSQADLEKIQSAKTYKLWQKLNKIKKTILKIND